MVYSGELTLHCCRCKECSHFLVSLLILLISKKAPELRRRELLEAISPDLIQLIVDECEEFLVATGACQLVQAVLLKCSGQ